MCSKCQILVTYCGDTSAIEKYGQLDTVNVF